MVLGQADGPLLQRQIDRPAAHPAGARPATSSGWCGRTRTLRHTPGWSGTRALTHRSPAPTAPAATRPFGVARAVPRHAAPRRLGGRSRSAATARTRGRARGGPAHRRSARSGRPRRDPARPGGSAQALRAGPCCEARRPAGRGSGAAPPLTSCPSSPSSSRSLKFPGE